ncbi:hypothetical protein [Denitrobaculum tricleocarpae]|uniref:Uncharacterized protein n=1 Tax=Denitrobaculum tricleocarpae TaxID=2591009 RepID=A0A545TEL5_9PROT|nr:hypothetical protein [Denitrobaculum tricleocarpae]TQV75665.1 hypothetical protein FKG95_22330 [Denitrobaculum tricleocarpae]
MTKSPILRIGQCITLLLGCVPVLLINLLVATPVLAIGWKLLAPYIVSPQTSRCTPLTIKFSVEGNDYTLVSTVWSATYHTTNPLAYANTAFVHRPNWVSQKLPSGAAVLFKVPHKDMRVLHRAREQHHKAPAYPYAYYFDDAKAPSVVEAIVSESYYELPSTRIRVSEIAAGKSINCDPPDLTPAVPWLEKEHAERRLEGMFAHVVTKEEWREIPELFEVLDAASEFTSIAEERLKPGLAQLPRSERGLELGQRKEVILQTGHSAGRGYRTQEMPLNHFVRPIQFLEGKATLLLDQPGLILYYPEAKHAAIRVSGIQLGGNTFFPKRRGWHFDPETGTLFKIRRASFF